MLRPAGPEMTIEMPSVTCRAQMPQELTSADEINDIVRRLTNEFGLPLTLRDYTWSPSKSGNTLGDKVYSRVKFLFFQDRRALDRVIDDFQSETHAGVTTDDLVKALSDKLNDPTYLAKGRLSHEPAGPGATTFMGKLRATQEPLNVSTTASTHPMAAAYADDARRTTESASIVTIPSTGNGNGAFCETRMPFMPPPKQPELSNKSSTKPVERPSTPPDSYLFPEHDFIKQPTARKRSSGDSSHARRSSKSARLADKPEDSKGLQASVSDLVCSNLTSANTSFVESFASTASKQTVSTTLTSFSDATDGAVESREDLQSSARVYGSSINDDDLDELTALEQDVLERQAKPVHPHIEDVNLDEKHFNMSQATEVDETADIAVQDQFSETILAPQAEGAPNEHYLIRDFPEQDFFAQEMPSELALLPFALRYEAFRAVKAGAIAAELLKNITSREVLWATIEQLRLCISDRISIWPCSEAVWKRLETDTNPPVTLSATAAISTAPEKPLFDLRMHPLKLEKSCRMQRRWGWDRMLSVDVPAPDSILPDHLRGQQDRLACRLIEWCMQEKHLLGRTWRVFHIQPIKRKKKGTKGRLLRVLFFAISGLDLEPIGIREPLNWAVPFEENSGQTSCKASTRIDLCLSATEPTLVFKPSQIRNVPDSMSDDCLEATEFNDPTLFFPADLERRIMNDGCARLSVGAAIAVCRFLGIIGQRPSVFQARINGAKGLWYISAPYDTSDAEHTEIWIEITKSQRKVQMRPADLKDDGYDLTQTTFDVVKTTVRPRSSSLHIDFLAILANRGVSREELKLFVLAQFDEQTSQLLTAMDDPAAMRRWLRQVYAPVEDRHRDVGIPMRASMPQATSEKVIQMLESGFVTTECRFLADNAQSMAKKWLDYRQRKLRIDIGKSTSVFGIADPTGTLEPGEIFLCLSDSLKDEATGETYTLLDRTDALVTRFPAQRISDVQKVKAVFKAELAHIKDVVVFSSKGRFPLASKLQGGDYDGDTFWICWDKRLTGSFLNAPAPLSLRDPSHFGIKTDKDTLGYVLASHVSGQTAADRWLVKNFTFHVQPELLGLVTSWLGRVAYDRNSISCLEAVELTDLHDHLLDAAKSGFIYSRNQFTLYLRKQLKIMVDPPKPAYAKASEGDQDDEDVSIFGDKMKVTRKWKPEHIVDYVVFEIFRPQALKLLHRLHKKLLDANTEDAALLELHERKLAKAKNLKDSDGTIREVLSTATSQLLGVRKLWGQLFAALGDGLTNAQFDQAVQRCFDQYSAIQPANIEHPFVAEWLEPDAPFAPVPWDLIKASMLWHLCRKSEKFVFLMAGQQLCWLKAHSFASPRSLCWQMYGELRPKKQQVVVQFSGVEIPDREEEYFDAAED